LALRVSVHVLTHHSRQFLQPCLEGLLSQTLAPSRILFIDCDSHDGTIDWLRETARRHPGVELLLLAENRGYAGGHNAGFSQSHDDLVLLLNPDVRLHPDYLRETVDTLRRHPQAGAATGRLLRGDDLLHPLPGPVLDSTGIIMTRSQRHLDRGAGEMDTGQYACEEEVFGVSGAAPLYRRAMLDDVTVDGEIFDEAFFAYREDADLAWRARLLGWSAIYTPAATAIHRRRVRPEDRRLVPALINRHSVKNRFLLRLKNQTASNFRRTWARGMARDVGVVGYVVLREWSSLPALWEVVARLGETSRKRQDIMSRRRASDWEVNRWFGPPWPASSSHPRP
jgi:GT2 family glycosyltransferase